MRAQRLVIFDGDDTLWHVERLYDRAREQAATVVASVGLDADRWRAVQRRIDVQNVARFGLSAQRFPTSCVHAYRAVANEMGEASHRAVEVQIEAAAIKVFHSIAPPVEGARDVLVELTRDYTLALLTQGDPLIQRQRIADSGLGSSFAVTHIPTLKTLNSFEKVLAAVGAEPHDACSVGNSLPSDINPALRLGMSAVWIPTDAWEYEHRETTASDGPVLAVDHLVEAPTAVASLLPAYETVAQA